MPALWQFKVQPITYDGRTIFRFHQKNKKELLNGKSYADFDISNALGDSKLLQRAQKFIRSLGFEFPLPIGKRAALEIFALRNYPRFEDWEASGMDYSALLHSHDAETWWRSKLHSASYGELADWVSQATLKALHKLSQQEKAGYARSILSRAQSELKDLEEFYGAMADSQAEVFKGLFRKLENLGSTYLPVTKPKKKG